MPAAIQLLNETLDSIDRRKYDDAAIQRIQQQISDDAYARQQADEAKEHQLAGLETLANAPDDYNMTPSQPVTGAPPGQPPAMSSFGPPPSIGGPPPAMGLQPPMPGQPSVPMMQPPRPGMAGPPPGMPPGMPAPPQGASQAGPPPPQGAGAPPGASAAGPRPPMAPPGAQIAGGAPPGWQVGKTAPPELGGGQAPPEQRLPSPPPPQVYNDPMAVYKWARKQGNPPEVAIEAMKSSMALVTERNKELLSAAEQQNYIEQAKEHAAKAAKAEWDEQHPKEGSMTTVEKEARRMQELEDAGKTNTTEYKALKAHTARMDRMPGQGGAAASSNAKLDKDTLDLMADQYLAGDKSVAAGLGYGNVGAQNRGALRKAIFDKAKEQGLSGGDIAARLAEYAGITAGERTAGVRTAQVGMAASEADNMANLVREASDNVPRTQFHGANKALIAFEEQTGGVEVRKLGAAINSFINAYARAVSPSGVPTVTDKEHAREILTSADTQEQLDGIIDQMHKEMAAAKSAPGAVRSELREAVTGKKQNTGSNLPTYTPEQLMKAIADKKVKKGDRFNDPNGNPHTVN